MLSIGNAQTWAEVKPDEGKNYSREQGMVIWNDLVIYSVRRFNWGQRR